MTATLTDPALDFEGRGFMPDGDLGNPETRTWAEVREIEANGWTITAGVALLDGHRLCARRGDRVRYINVVEGEV